MTSHVTKVVVRGFGHQAACSCGWSLDCTDAVSAARSCWEHARDSTPPIRDLTKQDA